MSTNVIVRLRHGESSERLIKRFVRKCKKERIVETYKEKTSYYIKPSVREKMKRKKALREHQKLERKRDIKLFR
jgi:ribosomal protein S21